MLRPIRSTMIALMVAALVGCASTDGARDVGGLGVVRGVVLVGPACPVEVQGSPCPDRPFRGTVRVLDASRDLVAEPETDGRGRFTVKLEPGTYTMIPAAGDRFPTSEPTTVRVDPGVDVEVTLRVDSGIR